MPYFTLKDCFLSKNRYVYPLRARVAKLVDAQDLKSWVPHRTCQFKSGLGHHLKYNTQNTVNGIQNTGQYSEIRSEGKLCLHGVNLRPSVVLPASRNQFVVSSKYKRPDPSIKIGSAYGRKSIVGPLERFI